MKNRVSIEILVIWISFLRQHESVALLLTETRGKTQWVLAPIHITIVIGERTHDNRLLLNAVGSCTLLVLGTHKSTAATLVDVRTGVKEKLHHRRVLVDDCYVQHVFTVIFVAHINIIYKIRVETEETFGQIGMQ